MAHPSTRRDFIKTSAQAAAAFALAPAFGSRAHASVLGANDSIGVGIIGIGIRGEILLRGTATVANTRVVEVADAYDTHFERARELVGPDLRTGRDYRRLLDNKDVQAVLIAVPDHWHKQMALDAMDAGKDVYIEKPMTHRWEDGEAIIGAAREKNRIVQVGSQWASVDANAQAIDIINSGKLGQVTLIDGRMHRNTATGAWYYPVPPDASPETIDWERFIGPAPPRPFDASRFFQWRLYLGLLGRPAHGPVRSHDHRHPHAHGREDGQPGHGDGRHPPLQESRSARPDVGYRRVPDLQPHADVHGNQQSPVSAPHHHGHRGYARGTTGRSWSITRSPCSRTTRTPPTPGQRPRGRSTPSCTISIPQRCGRTRLRQ